MYTYHNGQKCYTIKLSLGPIDRKFHGHDENDRFVLIEYIYFNNAVNFANIQTSTLWNKSKKITFNSKQKVQNVYGVTLSFISHCYGLITSYRHELQNIAFFLLNCFYSQLSMFDGIDYKTFWYLD